MKLKNCFNCHIFKPLSQFTKGSMICKDCKELPEIKSGGKNCSNGQSLWYEMSKDKRCI